MSYWRDKARQAIDSALDAAEAQRIKLSAMSSEQAIAVKRLIDESYPFGAKQHYPYQVWLDERRKTFYKLGLAEKKPDKLGRKVCKPPLKTIPTCPGQLNLFPDL